MAPHPEPAQKDQHLSTHGIALNMVGGHAEVPVGTNAELAAAAVSATEAVIQHEGQSFVAPIDQIDPNAVELACNDDGCALIPDDGNPHNDIIVDDKGQAPASQPAHQAPVHEMPA